MYCFDQFQTLVNAGAVNYIHPDQSIAGGIHQTSLAGRWVWERGIFTREASLHSKRMHTYTLIHARQEKVSIIP
jgi:hypothetical protein